MPALQCLVFACFTKSKSKKRHALVLPQADQRALWAMPALQCVFLAFFSVVAAFHWPLYNMALLGPAFVVGKQNLISCWSCSNYVLSNRPLPPSTGRCTTWRYSRRRSLLARACTFPLVSVLVYRYGIPFLSSFSALLVCRTPACELIPHPVCSLCRI